jgi:hypothetical protein
MQVLYLAAAAVRRPCGGSGAAAVRRLRGGDGGDAVAVWVRGSGPRGSWPGSGGRSQGREHG